MKKTKILTLAIVSILCFSNINVYADSLTKKNGEKRISFVDLLDESNKEETDRNINSEDKNDEEKKDNRKELDKNGNEIDGSQDKKPNVNSEE